MEPYSHERDDHVPVQVVARNTGLVRPEHAEVEPSDAVRVAGPVVTTRDSSCARRRNGRVMVG